MINIMMIITMIYLIRASMKLKVKGCNLHVDSCKIRADYEGWWLFSDWTDHIVEQYHFENYEKMLNYYQSIIENSKSTMTIFWLVNTIFMHFIIIAN